LSPDASEIANLPFQTGPLAAATDLKPNLHATLPERSVSARMTTEHSSSSFRLFAFDEREEILIDLVFFGGAHAVRRAFVDLQLGILYQFR
jgi:hypothetical protein